MYSESNVMEAKVLAMILWILHAVPLVESQDFKQVPERSAGGARTPHLSPFIASKCFNLYGQVQVQLHCPFGHGIRTLVAFTAISRYDSCTYEPWDCIVQPILAHRCEGRTTCFISDSIEGGTEREVGPLVCGDGTMPYMNIEYECALLTDFNDEPKVRTTDDELRFLTRMVIEKQRALEEEDRSGGFIPHLPAMEEDNNFGEKENGVTEEETRIEQNEAGTIPDETNPHEEKQVAFFDNKLIFSSIIGGSIVGAIAVITLVGLLVKRIKNRTYDDSALYGPPRRHRRSSRSSASDISHMLKEYPLQTRNFLAFLQQQRQQIRAQHLDRGDPEVTSTYT